MVSDEFILFFLFTDPVGMSDPHKHYNKVGLLLIDPYYI